VGISNFMVLKILVTFFSRVLCPPPIPVLPVKADTVEFSSLFWDCLCCFLVPRNNSDRPAPSPRGCMSLVPPSGWVSQPRGYFYEHVFSPGGSFLGSVPRHVVPGFSCTAKPFPEVFPFSM